MTEAQRCGWTAQAAFDMMPFHHGYGLLRTAEPQFYGLRPPSDYAPPDNRWNLWAAPIYKRRHFGPAHLLGGPGVFVLRRRPPSLGHDI
jgi:hypothetical protein